VAETEFGVVYDGPAVTSGRMDVSELAPALLGLAELFREANSILQPGSPPVQLEIQATAQGSFDVHLVITQADVWGAAGTTINLLSSQGVAALINLKELIIGSRGVFSLIKRLQGRTIDRSEPTEQSGDVVLHTTEGDTLTVPAAVLRVYRSATLRRRAGQVVAPLQKDGVVSLQFRQEATETAVSVELGPSDTDSFRVVETERTVAEQRGTMVYSIAAPSFVEGNKWRLTDGSNQTFYADIADQNFLARVDRGEEAFRKGDFLRCEMHIRAVQTDEGHLRTDYSVIRVVDHTPRTGEIPPQLFGDGDPWLGDP